MTEAIELTEDQAARVERLKKYIREHPGARLMDLEALSAPELQRLYLLAKKLVSLGRLLENNKTKALEWPGELQPRVKSESKSPEETAQKEVIDLMNVRILHDIPRIAIAKGEVRSVLQGEEIMMPADRAEALIKRGVAELVTCTDPAPSNAPTATPEALPVIEVETVEETASSKMVNPLIVLPERLRDPRLRFVKVRMPGEIYHKAGEQHVASGKEAYEPGWQVDKNYAYDDPEFVAHLAKGRNYGILCGERSAWLTVPDADEPELVEAVGRLPPTLTVKSGGGGLHRLLFCPEIKKKIVLERDGKHYGELQSTGTMIVGPGSLHHSGNRYEVIEDCEIAKVTEAEIISALRDFMPLPGVDTIEEMTADQPRGDWSWLDSLRIENVVDVNKLKGGGAWKNGANPWHGDNTKPPSNFGIKTAENRGYCFTCMCGVTPIKAVALNEGIIKSCNDKLRGADFNRAVDVAVEKYGLVRPARPAQEAREPNAHPMWRFTVDPSKKVPLDQLWRWPECFALIGLKCSVPVETCESELVAALERSGADADQLKEALEAVHKLYGKYGLGEDKIDKKARDNIRGCGLKVGEGFLETLAGASGISDLDLATTMMNMVLEGGSVLFHTPIGNPFIRIRRGGHYEIRPLDDTFERVITNEYVRNTRRAAPTTAVKTALASLESRAIEEGEVHELNIRVAHRVNDEGELEVWYDLADSTWRAICITARGWEVVDDPPILFYRTQYTYPQVDPVRGKPGALRDMIDGLVNVKSWQKPMVQIQFIADLLAISEQIGSVDKGGEGSGKSSKSKAEKALIDPMGEGEANILQNPRRDEDLELYLVQTYIAAVDNVSEVPGERSDILCTATTGGLRSKRAHHKNRQMINDRYRCAVRLNGISNPLTKPDALERTIEYIFDQKPSAIKDRDEWWGEFYERLPSVLADLFDLVSKALQIDQESPWTGKKARMGVWYRWAVAAAAATGMGREKFVELFNKFEANRKQAALDNDPLGGLCMSIADDEDPFIGTATTLLGLKESGYDDGGKPTAPRYLRRRAEAAGIDWQRDKMPKDAASLGRRLDRVAATLDNFGYELIREVQRDMVTKCPEYATNLSAFAGGERLICLRRKLKGAGGNSRTGPEQELMTGA